MNIAEQPAATATAAAAVDRIVWRRDLPALLAVTDETIRRMIKAHKLPTPDVDLTLRTRGWKISTLRAAGINLP